MLMKFTSQACPRELVVAQIMRKLSGAKDKLGLRVHGLIVGSPEKKRSDPAVLRSICSSILPNGKNEVRYLLATTDRLDALQ